MSGSTPPNVKVRQDGRVVSVAVVIAVGASTAGRHEVLGMTIGPSEAETFWTEFLRKLATRGLRGIKLVISGPRVQKLAALMDEAETDVLAYMDFPAAHRTKLHSTNPIEPLNGEIKRRTEVVGIFPNEDAITRLIGAIRLEQNDVCGSPPFCNDFGSSMMSPVLAVVYPALQRGTSTAGTDDVRGSAARQMDELDGLHHLWAFADPGLTGSSSLSVTLAS
jgi:transposase-like protein